MAENRTQYCTSKSTQQRDAKHNKLARLTVALREIAAPVVGGNAYFELERRVEIARKAIEAELMGRDEP